MMRLNDGTATIQELCGICNMYKIVDIGSPIRELELVLLSYFQL